MLPKVGFLIVGTPRSGTTLVQRLASELEGVRVPPETHLLSVFAHQIRRGEEFPWEGSDLREGLGRYRVIPQLESPGPEADGLCETLGGRAESILDVLDAVAWATASPGGRLYGEKTPGHLQWGRLVAQARPDVKLICVVRDPRAVALSQRETPWGTTDPGRSAMRWAIDQHEIRYLRRTFPERVLVLRYEDLVAAPAEARVGLSRFLAAEASGETPDPEVLYRPGETWKSLAAKEISDARADRWRTELAPEAIATIEAVARREMHRWAYEPADGTIPRSPLRGLRSGLGYRLRRQAQDLRIRHVLSRRCGLAYGYQIRR
jgi:hypothetical protein